MELSPPAATAAAAPAAATTAAPAPVSETPAPEHCVYLHLIIIWFCLLCTIGFIRLLPSQNREDELFEFRLLNFRIKLIINLPVCFMLMATYL